MDTTSNNAGSDTHRNTITEAIFVRMQNLPKESNAYDNSYDKSYKAEGSGIRVELEIGVIGTSSHAICRHL